VAILAYREIFWNISNEYLMYIISIIAVAFVAYTVYRHYKLWHKGKPDERSKDIGKRIWAFVVTSISDGLGHRRFLKDPYPGIMHLLIFWGCAILLLAAAVDATTHYLNIHLEGSVYLWFSLIVDIAGILALIGVFIAIYRRYVQKPDRLNTILDDAIVLSIIAIVIITGYIIEGLRLAATELTAHPEWAIWSPGGYVFAQAFSGLEQNTILVAHKWLWWFHAILVDGAIVYVALSYSKLQHIVISPLNAFFRNLGPVGAPPPIDMETAETLGVGEVKDFTWKQLLDLDACTNCGRCQDVCPAYISEKPLSPRKFTQDLKHLWLESARTEDNSTENLPALIGGAVTEDEIWACTTCAACQEACPVFLEHVVKIIDLRRNLTMMQSKMPENVQLMLRNMQTRGHPWVGAQTLRLRGDWATSCGLKTLAEDNNVDILFWVGCTAALCDRNVETTISLVNILKSAGIKFGILGEDEPCCGDPARRAGYEIQFQTSAEQNIALLNGYGIKKVLTTCPHCYNTFKNEYPKIGANFEVTHHTEMIADLLKEGKLELPEQSNSVMTYHDPCYLGRYNGVYEAPRNILRAFPNSNIKEMERSSSKSFCCGGGGIHMWFEQQIGTKINEIRTEEVLETRANTVVTSCPYCLQMLEEAIQRKELQDTLKVNDIAELVNKSINRTT
jgi:Fe-S oxidoreductase/nitrate reductase gamma subunit